jgi:YhcH/YjgK/YiaL family protein
MEKSHLIGKIAEGEKFYVLHPLFPKAFEFLKRPDIADLPVGRYDIDGDRCWANVQEAELKPLAERKLESHRRYIDIQAPITGPECIGLAEMDAAAQALPFDVENDYVLYEGASEPVRLEPGDFAIFFPPLGAHAPCCLAPNGPEKIKKVVVKVLAEA